jgi:hypothetical protein
LIILSIKEILAAKRKYQDKLNNPGDMDKKMQPWYILHRLMVESVKTQ